MIGVLVLYVVFLFYAVVWVLKDTGEAHLRRRK